MRERYIHFTNSIKRLKINKYALFDLIAIVFFLFLLAPTSLFQNLVLGLDGSWMMAIQMAVNEGLIFGKEFIFTYGPLGSLATRFPEHINRFFYFFLDIYIIINLSFILYYILLENKSAIKYFVVYIVIILLGEFHNIRIVFILSWILLFMLFHFITHRNIIALVNAMLLSILLFFIKINVGIVAIFFFYTLLVYCCFSHILSLKKTLILLSYHLVLLIIACFGLHVNMLDYIKGSLHLINAYNDAMYAPINSWNNVVFLSAASILLLYFLIFLRKLYFFKSNFHSLYIYIIIGLLIYILFKQGFVRLHTDDFFQNIALCIGLFFIFADKAIKSIALQALVITIFIAYLNIRTVANLYDLQSFKMRALGIKSYISTVFDNTIPNFTSEAIQRQIPEHILQTIGNKSIDILPWEISYLYFNSLNYNPRPVIQSYAAYDEYLDTKNYEKYISKKAPDFLLFQLTGSTDNRYPFFDESRTKLAILQNYRVIENTWEYLLLKRKETPFPRQTLRTEEGTYRIEEYIDLKSTNELQFFKASIEYSFLGKVCRFLFQPPELFVTLVLEDGSEQTFRAVKTIINGGILINKYLPINNADYNGTYNLGSLELFLNFAGTKSSNITKIKFHSNASWGFKDEFNFTNEFIRIESMPEKQSGDNLAQVTLPDLTNNIRSNIENLYDSKNYLEMSGWANIAGVNTEQTKVNIVLKSEKNAFVFSTIPVIRKDVSAYLNDNQLDKSGFRILINKANLPQDKYQLGIYITNGSNIQAFSLTENVLIHPLIHEPPADIKLPVATNNIQYWFDDLTNNPTSLNLKGWAFMKGKPTKDARTLIILKSQHATYMFETAMEKRPDVSITLADSNLDDSGFSVNISKNKLKSGMYEIGLVIEVNGDIKAFQIVDDHIDI